jgi:hypothetical protein
MRDHVSHVLDWWPTGVVDMPPGYHTTASSDFSELAPVLFDSHYMYDSQEHIAHYVHTSARNGSLLFDVAGAAGICRSTSVSMPMFDTNTNRYCTRMSKTAFKDTPTLPIDVPNIPEEETLWPFSQTFMDKYFESELCAATGIEVPWQFKQNVDPQSRSAGGIPGWQEYVTMDGQGKTVYAHSVYPPPFYELSPLHTLNHAWGPCSAKVKWGASKSCTSDSQCHAGASTCLPTTSNSSSSSSSSLCYSTATFKRSIQSNKRRLQPKNVRQPCFNTFHCQDGMVCLADGGCAPLYLHMW